jgi:hypothetical protein
MRNKILHLKAKAENRTRCIENTTIFGAKRVFILWSYLVDLEAIYDFDVRYSHPLYTLYEINKH